MVDTRALYAHTPAPGSDEWQLLTDHSLTVATLAADHAHPFGAEDIAWWLGLVHDAGKAHPDFQRYLQLCHAEPDRQHPTVDHKSVGAVAMSGGQNEAAQIILGHHGGLRDQVVTRNRISEIGANRLDWFNDTWATFAALELVDLTRPVTMPSWATTTDVGREFFMRMLFSCLVDADALDSEAFGNGEDALVRRRDVPTIEDLRDRFTADQMRLRARVERCGVASSPVNKIRQQVYEACIDRASLPPGFFRLTVPTGGGKTRSATAFALHHAQHHGLRRVVYAVPFLTITEQTVDVLRDALGDKGILEHHSGIAPRTGDNAESTQSEEERWRQLASDNWDAPIVVTTTVQLFESLLGNRTRQCRKLHNIARSVVILDEFQTVPAHLRATIFDVLSELVAHYGVSVILCTATQPVLDTIEQQLEETGLSITEIAPDPRSAFRTLVRVQYQWPGPGESRTWDSIACEMRDCDQVLTIVNTVRHAAELYFALDDPTALHLSTRMCGQHRRDILRDIRHRLQADQPCRVVSTQLIEAGVDIDFPVVMRAMGPLDRIAQAAGRCNREGRRDVGRVVVFRPEDDTMPGKDYRNATATTELMLREGRIVPDDPETFAAWFRQYFLDSHPDSENVQGARSNRDFETVADRFRMIDDDTFPVLVPYTDASAEAREALLKAAKYRTGAIRDAWRGIQPYVVTCRARERSRFEAAGLIVEILPGLWEWQDAFGYDEKVGLQIPDRIAEEAVKIDPLSLFI